MFIECIGYVLKSIIVVGRADDVYITFVRGACVMEASGGESPFSKELIQIINYLTAKLYCKKQQELKTLLLLFGAYFLEMNLTLVCIKKLSMYQYMSSAAI